MFAQIALDFAQRARESRRRRRLLATQKNKVHCTRETVRFSDRRLQSSAILTQPRILRELYRL